MPKKAAAENPPNPPFPQLNGQNWKTDTLFSEVKPLHQEMIIYKKEGDQRLYQVLARGEKGLTIQDIIHHKTHDLPIPATHVTHSKNYLFIAALTPKESELSGFYVIRLIDLYYFAFRSPIPVFFIPTNSELGKVIRVTVESNDHVDEKTLYISTDHDHTVFEIAFKEVEDLMKAQLIAHAMYQAFVHPNFAQLQTILNQFKVQLQSIIKNLLTDFEILKTSPEIQTVISKLQSFHLEEKSTKDLANVLEEAGESAPVRKLREKYTPQLEKLISDFYLQYETLIDTMDLSTPTNISDNRAEPSTSLSSEPDDEEIYALKCYAGIALGTAFLTLVLPKILKKPFSKMAADYSLGHFKFLTKSHVRQVGERLFPELVSKNQGWFSRFINSLGENESKLSKLIVEPEHFKRAAWQTLGNTASVIFSEIVTRPFISSPTDDPSVTEKAILLTRPFSEDHTLWINKNTLYRVAGNQILGTINGAVGLAELEHEIARRIHFFVYETGLEYKIGQALKDETFSLAKHPHYDDFKILIKNDLKRLKELVEEQVLKYLPTELHNPCTAEDLKRLIPGIEAKWKQSETQQAFIETLCKRWMVAIERNFGAVFTAAEKETIQTSLRNQFVNEIQASFERFTTERLQDPKIGRKIATAMGIVTSNILKNIFGTGFANKIKYWAGESFEYWWLMNKTYFFNGTLMQTLTRGSPNPTLFGVSRSISLVTTTPIFIILYSYFGHHITTKRREFAFGLVHGLISNTVSNAIFVEVFEKRIKGSMLDMEAKRLWAKDKR